MGRLAYALVLLAALIAPTAQAELPKAALDLIIRWEVGSQARYQRLYRGIICPGYISGPTFGIGYDGGHQRAATIRQDWAGHAHVERLERSAGVMGDAKCRAYGATVRDVRVEWDDALRVFVRTSIHNYTLLARRTYPAFDQLPGNAQGALVSLTYNRGTSLKGERRREMATIARVCGADTHCIAGQLRLMVRVWQGSDIAAGMTSRRHDEARLAETP